MPSHDVSSAPGGKRTAAQNLRIVLAPSAYYPHVGGIEELTRQLALAFEQRGHRVSVLTNRWPDGVSRNEVLDGLQVVRLRFPLPAARPFPAARLVAAGPVAALELAHYLRRVKPDVVHVIGAGPQSVYLGRLTPHRNATLVFTAQGELSFDADNVFQRSATLRAGLRHVLRTADAVTACSAFVLRDLERVAAIRRTPFVVPNGVDPGEFDDCPPEQGFGAYVLGVGRLVPQKGFDVLLHALASDSLSHLNLVLAGDGFERPNLEALADRLGIGPRTRFLGSVDRHRLGQLLRGARVFAFPSRGEAFGIALLEAMATGVPAVAAAAGGVPELAIDGENALLVEPDNSRQLAAAIARLDADETVRQRLAHGGAATAQRLNWANLARSYENVYAGALASRTA